MNYFSSIYSSPIGDLFIIYSNEYLVQIHFTEPKQFIESKTISAFYKIIETQLNQYFQGTLTQFSIPIYLEGTAFQQQVWNELQTIPFGKTISYLDLSKQIGNVKAIRAVGTANGKNPIPIVVPCHRVIGSNGKLVGFSGGIENKRWLLLHEAKQSHQTLF